MVRWVIHILPLQSVADGTIDEISEVDKDLATQQAFPEIEPDEQFSICHDEKWRYTYGRRISANKLGKSVAPPKEKTACIKPLMLSRKLSPGGVPAVVEIGGGLSMPFGKREGNDEKEAV